MSVWEALVEFDRARPRLGEQLTAALREAIAAGRLAAGTRLPSTRDLAADLRLSRGLVVGGVRAARSPRGGCLGRRGSGTVVAPPRQRTAHADAPPAVRTWSSRRSPAAAPRAYPIWACSRATAWRRAYEQALATAADADLGYGDPAGAPRLRAELAGYLGRVRAARLTADDARRHHRRRAGVRAVAAALLQAGATPDRRRGPGQPRHPRHLAATGCGRYRAGRRRRARRRGARRAGVPAVLVTPAHQFPTGVVLAPARRAALIAWARRTGGLIVEDDYDAEFRYDRDPVGCLQGLAPDVVAHLGSVSKALAPGAAARLARRPPDRRARSRAAKAAADHGGPALEQLAFAGPARDRRLRPPPAPRAPGPPAPAATPLVAALAPYLPRCRVPGVAAGLHLVVELPPGVDDAAWPRGPRAAGLGPSRCRAPGSRPAARPDSSSGTPRTPRTSSPRSVERLSRARDRLGWLACREFVPLAERIVDALLDSDPAPCRVGRGPPLDDQLPDLSTGRGGRGGSPCCATPPTRCPRSTPTRWTPRSRSTTRS